jgi:hypothetical protein
MLELDLQREEVRREGVLFSVHDGVAARSHVFIGDDALAFRRLERAAPIVPRVERARRVCLSAEAGVLEPFR